MEENEEEVKDTAKPDGDEQPIPDKPPLDMAEDYINWGELAKAQEILNTVKEKSGRKFYLQSLIYKQKLWYSEQRKALKAAIKAEPDNEIYREELEALNRFSKTPEYKSAVRNRQMGDATSLCAECGCYCCMEGLCEAICDGCS